MLSWQASFHCRKVINMKIKFKLFPKYQFLVGVSVTMCETFEISTEKTYDSVDIQIGIGVLLLTATLTYKKKGSN